MDRSAKKKHHSVQTIFKMIVKKTGIASELTMFKRVLIFAKIAQISTDIFPIDLRKGNNVPARMCFNSPMSNAVKLSDFPTLHST